MKHTRLFRSICTAAICALCAGCATSATVREMPRERAYQFAPEQASAPPHVAFIPKGAYILGLNNDQSFSTGTWVRLTPGSAWPDAESRPTLITAQVAERAPNSARLEMAAFHPGIRTADLTVEPYTGTQQPAQALHAMTKRMAFATSPVHDGPVAVTLTAQDLIEGSEIYGALSPQNTGTPTRLANQITALYTVADRSGDAIKLTKSAGNTPDAPVFILLDAPLEPAFDITVTLAPDMSALEDALRRLAAQNALPGMTHVHIERAKNKTTAAQDIDALCGTQTETLSISVREDNRSLSVISQSLRLRDNIFPAILDHATPDAAAVRIAAHALALLGHHASAAFLLEQAWGDTNSAEERAAIAPMLAQAYHDIERDDWALEIALELNGYFAQTKNTKVRAAAAAIFALTGRAREFSKIFGKAASDAPKLPASYQKLMLQALLLTQDMPGSDTHLQSLKHALSRSGNWNSFDEMALCAGRIDLDDEACSEGLDHANTPFEKLWFGTLEATRDAETPRLLDLALEADAIGAPNLAIHLWTAIIQNGLAPDAALSAYKTLADYLKTSGNARAYAHLMAELASRQAASGHPVDAQTYAGTLALWRALDYREELATLCTARSASVPISERIDLLSFAGMLYRSIGDAENSAITDSLLSRAHQAAGNTREAEACKSRALRYAGTSEHPEVKQAIRENLTQPAQVSHEAQ